MSYTAAQIRQTHPEYEKYVNEWKFLQDSYLGGADWQDGQYLTRYIFESDEEYQERVSQTPYDNHCRSVVHLYNSFLFSMPPHRELGDLAQDARMQAFLEDADLDGRNWNQFMRQVDITTSVFGSAWIVIDKPEVQVLTAADEIALGVRPYASLFTPLNVLDWQWTRRPNGRYELTYLKVVEDRGSDQSIIKLFYPDRTDTVVVRNDNSEPQLISSVPNMLGRLPVVVAYNTRSATRGIGISDLTDVARMNRSVYDEHSEIVQIIRLSNHPSLVKTAGTQAAAGAGAIIQMEDNMDPGLKPFLLQPDSASLDGVRASIADKIEAINRMTSLGSVRAMESRTLSGVALETEMRTLNAKLSEKGDQLELCEEQVFELWCEWLELQWTGMIKYPDSFNARDRMNDLKLLNTAMPMIANNPDMMLEIQRQVAGILVEDTERLAEMLDSIEQSPEQNVAQESEQTEITDDSTDRVYPDGQPIPESLPPAYQSSASDGVPEGQACGNCEYNLNQQCTLFANAPIRESWWCLKWEANE
jgi:hypothetical protein